MFKSFGRPLLLSLFLLLAVPLCIKAQKFEPTSINLSVLDGLASNNVYCAMQDVQGYIWFGTETGVSRYNGREFENFYMSDGLADNEIFRIDQDSQGRIWFSALNGKLSYYKDGRFFNGKNDPSLALVSPETFYLNFFEDSHGNIWLNTKRELINIQKSGHIKYYGRDWNRFNPVTGFFEREDKVWGVNNLHQNLIEFSNKGVLNESPGIVPYEHLSDVIDAYFTNSRTHLYGNGTKVETVYLKDKYKTVDWGDRKITKVHKHTKGVQWICTYNGVIRIETDTGASRVFFEGDIVTHVLKDREGGFWFTFLGKGIAYVPSLKNTSIRLTGNNSSDYVSALMKDGKTIWFGGSEGKLGRIANDSVELVHLFKTNQRSMIKGIVKGVGPEELWIAAETKLVRTKGLRPLGDANTSAKVIRIWGGDKYALGLSGYFIIMSEDQIYHDIENEFSKDGRRMAFEMKPGNGLHFQNNSGFVFDIESYGKGLLVSTSLGLYFMDENFDYALVDGPDATKERINDILIVNEKDYALATHGYGTYLWKNGQWHHFSEEIGLDSDICRKVITDGDGTFWIATNKGVNRVKFDEEFTEISNLTKADGLLSEEIYDLVISENNLIAATSEGISIIDIEDWEARKGEPTIKEPVLTVEDVAVHTPFPTLKHNAQNIRLDFDGLHFKSLDRLSYQYRLLGQSDDWKESDLNWVNFGNLPPGNYTFQVRAVSAFGGRSATAETSFSVEMPFWMTWWFIVLMVVLFVSLVALAAMKYVRYNQRKSQQELEFKLKLANAERKALQSQLNPHFIFNSLNSVQSMVLTNNPKEAYDYLEKFGKLIRRVLEFSDASMISLEDELSTLKLYLDLENERLKNKFEYRIEVSEEVETTQLIPSMVIQPFVENSIWHGIIPLKKIRKGKISIEVYGSSEELFIEVIDNGVGRKAKSTSNGMGSKIADRLAQNLSEDRIGNIRIEDVTDNGQIMGTKVTLRVTRKEYEYDKSLSY